MKDRSQTVTVILCGGRGTRALPHTLEVPKPLLDVAGKPVVQHVMEIYAHQGFVHFVLAAGYRPELVEEFARGLPAEWDVDVVDTGESASKGERILALKDRLRGTFFVTYGDGLGNVDLFELRRFHDGHDGCATVTVVPLPSQYGTMDFDEGGRVHGFQEKPRLRDHWINAGFFVMDDRIFGAWKGDDLETDVLPALSAAGELYAFRHEGFWKSMDTFKDGQELTALAKTANEKGEPPWLDSAIHASS